MTRSRKPTAKNLARQIRTSRATAYGYQLAADALAAQLAELPPATGRALDAPPADVTRSVLEDEVARLRRLQAEMEADAEALASTALGAQAAALIA